MADSTIAKAYVQIIPTTKGIKNTLNAELGGSADAAGKSFGKKMIDALGKIGIGAAVGKIIKDSVSEGAALEQSIGGIETLFETSSKAISAHIKNVGDSVASNITSDAWTKLGEDVYKAAGNFESFKNDVGTSMDAVADALSFGIGTALEDQNGYIETLRTNYNMTADDAQKMYESVSAAIKNNNDMLPEYASNLTTVSDATETMMKNAANAYKTAGLSANEYMETVTSFSASLLQSLGGDTIAAAEYADMAIVDMSDNANKMGTSMESIQNAYQGFAKQNYTMLDNLKLGYGGTKEEMQRLLKDATAISGIKYDMNNLADVYSAIHVIQTEIGITGTTAKEASSTVSGSLSQMKAAFQNVLGNLALGEDITPALDALSSTVTTFITGNLIPMASNVIGQLPDALCNAVIKFGPNIIPAGIDLLSKLITGIGNATPKLLTTAAKLVPQMANKLIENGPKLFSAAKSALGQIVRAIPGIAAESMKGIVSVGGNLIKGLWNGISDKVGWILGKIKGFGQAVIAGIKDIFGIHSPSKETAWMGEMLMQGLANGIDDNAKKAVNSMRNAADSALGAVDAGAFSFGGGNYTFNGTSGNAGTNNIVLNVYGAQGQDINALADIVMQKIQFAVERREAVYA